MSDLVEKSAGEYVMREGEESTTMYFVQSGSLAVYKRKGNVEQQIGTIYAGELVGEMSFLDKEPRCATVKAISDITNIFITSDYTLLISLDEGSY